MVEPASPEELNEINFAQRCIDAAARLFVRTYLLAEIDNLADHEASVEVLEAMLNVSPLVGQYAEVVVVDEVPDGTPPVRIIDFGLAFEETVQAAVLPGRVAGFFVGHQEHGVIPSAHYSSEQLEETTINDTNDLFPDTLVKVLPWLGVRIEYTEFTLPGNTTQVVAEIPLVCIDGIRMGSIDHPLMPDKLRYDAEMAVADNELRADAAFARMSLDSDLLGRTVELKYVTGEVSKRRLPESETEVLLPNLASCKGELVEYTREDGQLNVVVEHNGLDNLISIPVDAVIAGSMFEQRTDEDDMGLFDQITENFYGDLEHYLATLPDQREIENFIKDWCQTAVVMYSLVMKNRIAIRVDSDSSYQIVASEPSETDRFLEVDTGDQDEQKLWVGSWKWMLGVVCGFAYTVDEEAALSSPSPDHYTLNLVLGPQDRLAALRGAAYLIIPLHSIVASRLADTSIAHWN